MTRKDTTESILPPPDDDTHFVPPSSSAAFFDRIPPQDSLPPSPPSNPLPENLYDHLKQYHPGSILRRASDMPPPSFPQPHAATAPSKPPAYDPDFGSAPTHLHPLTENGFPSIADRTEIDPALPESGSRPVTQRTLASPQGRDLEFTGGTMRSVVIVDMTGQDRGETLAAAFRKTGMEAASIDATPDTVHTARNMLITAAPDAAVILASDEPTHSAERLALQLTKDRYPALLVSGEKPHINKELLTAPNPARAPIAVIDDGTNAATGKEAIIDSLRQLITQNRKIIREGMQEARLRAEEASEPEPFPLKRARQKPAAPRSLHIIDFSLGNDGEKLESALRTGGMDVSTMPMATSLGRFNAIPSVKNYLATLKENPPGAIAVIANETPEHDSFTTATLAARELKLPVIYVRAKEHTPATMKEGLKRCNIPVLHHSPQTEEGSRKLGGEIREMLRTGQVRRNDSSVSAL